jgi:hypothetical protein
LTKKSDTLPPASEAELFKPKGSKCHDPELALKEYRSAEAWHDTITRMKKEHNANITRKEIDILVKYHVERQKQGAAVFRDRCE